MDKKVSIIVPVFNMEKFLDRFLNNILEQTYNNIELIIVDDGSNDKSFDIIDRFKEKYKNRGYEIRYFYKENGGVGDSINFGIKKFTGDYLTWLDPDDFLSVDSIYKKVCFLEDNKEYGFVRTSADMYCEYNLNESIGYLGKEKDAKEDIFEEMILEKVGISNGKYLVKSESFLKVNPNREIYNSKSGQNWQILLPIAYKYKCGYIDEELFHYVVRADSHSRIDEGINEEVTLNKYFGHEDILINTISRIVFDKNEKQYYLNIVKEKYARRRLYIAKQYKNKKLANENLVILKELNKVKLRDRVICLSIKYKLVNDTMKLMKKAIKF